MSLTKKPNCILHIGMHKTGSSAIQKTLCNLNTSEFEYLKFSPDGNHSEFILNIFLKKNELYHSNIKRGLSKNEVIEIQKKYTEDLKSLLKATQSKTVIISSEDILSLNENELLEFREFLMQYCQSIRVIGYVRPPIAYMQSAFQEYIKNGVTTSFPILYPNYKNKFEKFDRIFKRENVLFLKYDSSTLLDKDVVLDFCHHAGIAINPELITHINESISLEATSLLYVYHKFGHGYGSFAKAIAENNLLIKAISCIGNKKIQFSPSLSRSLLETKLEDIQWMEARLGSSLDESLVESNDSISSENDLFALSIKSAEDLKRLLFDQIQQPVTPQKVADWMHLLRQQLSNSNIVSPPQLNTAFSIAQVNRLKAENLQLTDMLKELVLSLSRSGLKDAATNVSSRLMLLLLPEGDKLTHNKDIKISFSIGMYQNGYMMGWILDEANPLRKLTIELHSNQKLIGKGIADQFRQDLANAEIGDGYCSFKIKIDSEVKKFGDQIIIHVINYDQDFFVKTASIRGLLI
jgi:hypothetical protein